MLIIEIHSFDCPVAFLPQMDNIDLRIKIKDIQQSDCSESEKSRRMQSLMTANWKPFCMNAEAVDSECRHYQRNCKIVAPCCDKLFGCRHCHDEASEHKIDRSLINSMVCLDCNTKQDASSTCSNCQAVMASYYCNICKFWEDNPGKSIYHCDGCKICRVGKGLDIDYFHCDKCNACIQLSLKNNHKCIERNLESDCPICGDYMFTSISTVIFMVFLCNV